MPTLFRTLSARSLFITRICLWPLIFSEWSVALKTPWPGPLSLSPLEMKTLLMNLPRLDLVIWWDRIWLKLPAIMVSAVILVSLPTMLSIPGVVRLGRAESRLRQHRPTLVLSFVVPMVPRKWAKCLVTSPLWWTRFPLSRCYSLLPTAWQARIALVLGLTLQPWSALVSVPSLVVLKLSSAPLVLNRT